MASHSPHPTSLSPQVKTTTAFHWPIPGSPSHLKPITHSHPNNNMNELTVKEILERYSDDPELMKYILTAKSEEDKKKAAKDTLKAEEARIQLRQMDLDFARPPSAAATGPPPPQHGQGYAPYYGLAPVQQQVLARFNYPPHYGGHQSGHPPPSSPSVPYPHSAHPLCTSTDRVQQLRQSSPTSPITEETNPKKRTRSSISVTNEPINEQHQDKLSHNKVMEALKAKIQRGNGGPPSPLTASPVVVIPQDAHNNKKRKPTLPRPVIVHSSTISSPSPSPRSAKPVLPPIDTNLGRMDIKKLENTTSSSSSSSSSNHSQKSVKDPVTTSTTTTATTTATVAAAASPSDHILLNTRRARSLSPSSVKKA
ncbi:uncharacterized protein EV154DRAFT_458778 [Mucor mucedo]|uniref:uncharacterized protein n=1 Tax=Mucor mucedo TaxID=29922 RepID=UPI00221E7C7B|nr:uncharacterized protein EV154DRAFT_458778 [Mucor mucedo]KAI7894886.1 hypothetical protein EV154DRAFT_458778 [Mucor mucedo]